MNYLITVDIGTTSTKTLAFSESGDILAKANIAYTIISDQTDHLEQDPEEIFRAIKESLKTVIDETGPGLLGICFSSAMHSLIIVDDQGNPITNSIIWGDNRSKSEADELNASSLGMEIYHRTGTPIHPMSPLCKIAWFKNSRRDLFDKAYKFISIKEYVFYKFFGEYVIDHSIASATGLFDIYDLKWNKAALDYLEITEEKLSRPVSVTYSLKNLDPTIRQELNLKDSAPFIIGASDGCLANLGANSISQGQAAVTMGTSGAIRIACNSPKPDLKQRVFKYLLDEHTFIVGGPINNGAIVLNWFKENFCNVSEFSDDDAFFKMVEEKATEIIPGSNGLIFLPYLLGERAPIWNSNAKGVFFGIDINHTKYHFLKAILEGLAFALFSIGNTIEELTGNIEVISAGGGMSKSGMWCQLLADVFNKKVVINNSSESSSLGAAVLGFKALGVYEGLDEIHNIVEVIEEYFPDPAKHQKYLQAFHVFESLYKNVKEDFNSLNLLKEKG